MKKVDKNGPWTTQHEIDFLKGLGTHIPRTVTSRGVGPTRPQLLISYLETMKDRTEWGGIDPLETEIYIKRALARQKGG